MEEKKEDCIFCKIVSGEIPAEKVYEDDNFIAIKDVHPLVEGHCVVLSKKHFVNLIDCPASLYGEFLEAAEKTAMKLIKEVNAEGFNLHMNNFEVAGQVVKHMHLHVLPRKKGDGFKACA